MRDTKAKTYERFLDSVDPIKRDFLFQVRQENRNTPDERVAVFVDVQNIYYAAKDNLNGKIDFKKLLENALQGRRFVTAKAYVVNSEIDNSPFIKILKQFDYEIVSKDLRTRKDGSQKGNLDIEMTIDIMEIKDQVDTVIIASGDGDFVPLVEYLKKQNIQIELYSVPDSTAMDLKNSVSKYFKIDESYLYIGS